MDTARRVIAYCTISLDGYSGGPDGPAHDRWLHEHARCAATTRHFEGLWRGCDAVLVGRTNFVGYAAVWPGMTADPSTHPRHRALGRWMAQVDKAVVTTTLDDAGLAEAARRGPREFGSPPDAVAWTNARAFPDPAAALARLQAEPGADIIVLSSASVIAELLRADLVDVLALTTVPVLLGGGLRLLGDGARSDWAPETVSTLSDGAVAAVYQRAR